MKESIKYLSNKIKLLGLLISNQDVFVVILIILVSFASFGLGRLSKIEENKSPLQIISKENTALIGSASNLNKTEQNQKGKYVASKKGTRYYLPWCSQTKRISPKNKIWFSSKKEAEKKGYLPVKKCKGV